MRGIRRQIWWTGIIGRARRNRRNLQRAAWAPSRTRRSRGKRVRHQRVPRKASRLLRARRTSWWFRIKARRTRCPRVSCPAPNLRRSSPQPRSRLSLRCPANNRPTWAASRTATRVLNRRAKILPSRTPTRWRRPRKAPRSRRARNWRRTMWSRSKKRTCCRGAAGKAASPRTGRDPGRANRRRRTRSPTRIKRTSHNYYKSPRRKAAISRKGKQGSDL